MDIAIYQSLIAFVDSIDADAIADGCFNAAADNSIHAGSITATGKDTNTDGRARRDKMDVIAERISWGVRDGEKRGMEFNTETRWRGNDTGMISIHDVDSRGFNMGGETKRGVEAGNRFAS